MNSFKAVETEYITSSRTLETIVVSNTKSERVFYVYNYEGYSFRVFKTLVSLFNFFDEGKESDLYFQEEFELDNYFSSVLL